MKGHITASNDFTHVNRSSYPEVFSVKGGLKSCCKVSGEHPCRSTILVKLQSNFIERLPPLQNNNVSKCGF